MAQQIFSVFADWVTSEHAGAGGTFQVSSIEDEQGNDRTGLVDQGFHYHDAQEVAGHIATRLGVPVGEVRVELK